MQKFGRTWWGQQWLQALDRIDFSNRLERGISYANKGAVNSIQIHGNCIEAKVQGSQRKPYRVTIIVPPFFDEEKNIFMKGIIGNPLVLSRLFNRELPSELLQLGEKNNVKIFPKSWQDIKLNCSCPDWAVPCKHLAAVIYMVANEIDQNPFLVFNLHNFDIVEELSKQHIEIRNLEKEKILTLQDCVATKLIKTKSVAESLPCEVPDFSKIENLLNTIPNLFLSNTLFYSGDFKSTLQTVYKRAAKNESAHLIVRKTGEKSAYNDLRFASFKITFATTGNAMIEAEAGNKFTSLTLTELLLLLAQTESKHLENYSDTFIALYRVFRYCNVLVERGAILPRMIEMQTGSYKMLWLPAFLNDSVKSIFIQLLSWIPKSMIRIRLFKESDFTYKKKKKEIFPADASSDVKREEALQLLCTLFISHSIQNAFEQNSSLAKTVVQDRKILDLFYANRSQRFELFQEKEIPNTIQLWLKRFHLNDQNIVPVISVNETAAGGFEVEVLVKDMNHPLQQTESLFSFLKTANEENKIRLFKNLNLLGEYFPDLNKIIETSGKTTLVYKGGTFSEVLLKILPTLKLFGIKALLPKSLQHLLRPQVSIKLSSHKNNKKYFSLDELINYDWKVAMGDMHLSKQEFEKLSRNTFGLVKIRDRYVMMNEDDVSKIIRQLENPAPLNKFTLLQAALSGDFENAPVLMDKKLTKQIKDLMNDAPVPLPIGLKATLRPYQHRGFNWIYKNSKLGIGSLLADDMGLGKTLQVITSIQKFKEEGALKNNPALVVVPTTLLTNWMNEINKFAPELRTLLFHGTGRKFNTKNVDVVITTYGIVRTENEKISKQNWYVMVVDEAQNIKNPEIAQTKYVKKINAKIKIAMSGTPVENRLNEYWSIFDFANPNYLGNVNWFSAEYSRPIELNQDQKKLQKFKLITSPFIMRRMKTDKSIIADLPEKVENNQYCNLSKEQAALYQNLTHDLMNEVENAEGINRRGLILKLLMVLKQVCNHPTQYLKNDNHAPELSGKMMLLLQLLETIYENNEKVLVFSQYKEMGDILRMVIQNHFGKKALQLHGGCSRNERDEMVHAFQNSKQADTFILSIKAGGTGLNLTAAANVIHYDLWWNPAVEAQATDRAFRIGQKKNVMVHRMITKGTLEEKIDEMIRSKKKLANLTVSSGEKWIGELSDKDLKSMVSFEAHANSQ